MNDKFEAQAAEAITAAVRPYADQTETVQLWEDEWEQWHVVDEGQPGTAELPARAVEAVRFAAAVWSHAQGILTVAVDNLAETFPELARDHGWHHELFRGEITPDQLAARLESCNHPADQLTELAYSNRCDRCGQLPPMTGRFRLYARDPRTHRIRSRDFGEGWDGGADPEALARYTVQLAVAIAHDWHHRFGVSIPARVVWSVLGPEG